MIAHLGFNVAGLDLNFPAADNVAIIQRLAGLGFNIFRVPFKWELAFPILPNVKGTVNATYMANMMQYVEACKAVGATIILDMHNFGQYSFGGNEIIIGTSTEPGAPVAEDLVASWLAIANWSGIKDQPFVRLGIMNEPHLSLDLWAPIHNQVVSTLRTKGVTNIVHATDKGSTAFNIEDMAQFQDSKPGGTIFEIHLYTDATQAGIAAIPEANINNYADMVASVVAAWEQLPTASQYKIFWGEVGFDAGAPAQASLPLFLSAVDANPDVFDGVTFWSAGQEFGADYIYDMNQVAVTTFVECQTTLEACKLVGTTQERRKRHKQGRFLP
jgi:endoglucanase